MAKTKMRPEWRAKIAESRRKQEQEKRLKLSEVSGIPGISGEVDKGEVLASASLIEAQYALTVMPDPMAIKGFLNSTSNGQLQFLMEFYDLLQERDPQLNGLVVSRKNAVAGKPLSIQPLDLDEKSKSLAEFIQYCIRRISNLQKAIYHLLDGVYRGVSVCEIRWGYDETNNIYLPIELVPIHGKKIGFDINFEPMFYDPWNPELNYKKLSDYPNKFIVHIPSINVIYPTLDGLFRPAALYSFAKSKALAYWLNGAERFAIPTIYAKVPKQTPQDIMIDLRRSLNMLTSAGVAVFKGDTEINTLTSGMAGGDQVWLGLARYCDAQITKLICGGTLTVEAGNAGSYALGEVHERVRQDLLEGDGEAICRTLERDLFAAIVRMNKHILDESAAIPACYFDGLEVYKPITDLDINAGVIRLNDILREKGLPEIPLENGGESFILSAEQSSSIKSIVENEKGLETEIVRNLLSISVPTLTKEQIDTLVPVEPIEETIISVDAGGASVADTALNGAQVSSLVEMLGAITNKTLNPSAAKIAIKKAFPSFTEQEVSIMVDAQANAVPTENTSINQ